MELSIDTITEFLNKKQPDRTCSVDVLAYVLNMSPRRVQILAQQGVVVRAGRGRYFLIQSVHAYIAYMRDQLSFFAGDARV